MLKKKTAFAPLFIKNIMTPTTNTHTHIHFISSKQKNKTGARRDVTTRANRLTEKQEKRQKRHKKIRSTISGTAKRPRISVYRSNQHVFVQVIDDDAQKTLVSLGTQSKELKDVIGFEEWKTKTVSAANELGKMLGKKCVDTGINHAVFDRGGFLFHGRVKAVADGCREAGVAI